MTNHEQRYWVISPLVDDAAVVLMPDMDTAGRKQLSAPLVPGKPLRFSNGFADRLADPRQERLDDMLNAGMSFAVRDRVRELLEPFDILGLQFYPMVFADASGREHADFWFMNLYAEQPFMDRARLVYAPGTARPGRSGLLLRYAFDTAAMDAVAEEQRLIFFLENDPHAHVFAHERIVRLLQDAGVTGFRAFQVSTFSEGDQYA